MSEGAAGPLARRPLPAPPAFSARPSAGIWGERERVLSFCWQVLCNRFRYSSQDIWVWVLMVYF